MMNKKKITVIGIGRMGEIILASMRENLTGFEIYGVEKKKELRCGLKKKLDIEIFENIHDAPKSGIYIIAVKPQDFDEVLEALASSGKIIISIAAGITTDYIKKFVHDIEVVRVMPNTPCIVGEGVSIISAGSDVSSETVNLVEKIFGGMGKVLKVEESLMDTVTALSGSGPAYFFLLAEIMEKFAVDNSIDRDLARVIISQTIKGAGVLMAESNKSFSELRQDVTSPGGTTEAAIKELKENKFIEVFYKALSEAKIRSGELSRKEGG